MKKVFYSMLAFAFVLTTTSCSDDDDDSSDTTVADVTTTITDGVWRITNFDEDGDDHTNDFTGFTFTFDDNNVLTADNGTNAYVGSWAVTDGSNDDSSNDVDLNIVFGFPDNFVELSEDWDVIERTSTKVRLRHVSGGNGGTDNLTFEKD